LESVVSNRHDGKIDLASEQSRWHVSAAVLYQLNVHTRMAPPMGLQEVAKGGLNSGRSCAHLKDTRIAASKCRGVLAQCVDS
jgi:hypothetical protein